MHVEVRINFTHASIFVQPAEYVDAEILCTSIYWKKKKKKDKREGGGYESDERKWQILFFKIKYTVNRWSTLNFIFMGLL